MTQSPNARWRPMLALCLAAFGCGGGASGFVWVDATGKVLGPSLGGADWVDSQNVEWKVNVETAALLPVESGGSVLFAGPGCAGAAFWETTPGVSATLPDGGLVVRLGHAPDQSFVPASAFTSSGTCGAWGGQSEVAAPMTDYRALGIPQPITPNPPIHVERR